MQITIQEYEDILFGFYIYGCAIRDRNKFGFIADRWYSDAEVEEEERNKQDPAFRDKRLVTFFRDDPVGDQWGATDFENWGTISLGAALHPQSQYVAVELEEDRAYVIGSGESGIETFLSEKYSLGNPNRGGIRRIKMIGGYAYVCGGSRSVGKRIGKEKWLSHTDTIPRHPERSHGGFDDIDGFDENDLYAVGGMGDVWRYDGKHWQQVAFPTNTWVQAVCCGGDGNVYISCYEGLTFMGRENRWKKIHDGGISLGFKDMVWHEDRVWCTNDNGLWTIHQGKLERVSGLPPEIYVCSGRLSAHDGVLLMAGLGGAAFRENGQWHSLYLRTEMERAVREKRGN